MPFSKTCQSTTKTSSLFRLFLLKIQLDMAAAAPEYKLHLLSLPEDTIICILSKLNYENLITVGFVCKSLYHLALTDNLWMSMCGYWKGSIDVREWRKRLNSGKALFRLLRSFQKLIGVWSASELYPRGGILYVKWGNLCLIGARVWTRLAGDVILRPLFEVAGLQDGSFKIQFFIQDVDFKFPVKLIWSSIEEVEFEFQLCNSREDSSSSVNPRDAETVDGSSSYMSSEPTKLLQTKHLASIVKSLGPDHRVLGADDEFLDENANLNREQLIHRFFRPANQEAGTQDQVSTTNPEWLRGGHIGCQAIQQLTSMYTFDNPIPATKLFSSSNRINKSAYTKLKVDEPKPGQELAGLWKGIYGPHGLEIVNVSYTNDEIIATKLLGDPNVPCSEVTFKVKLSSINMDARMDLRRILIGLEEEEALDIYKMYRGCGRIAGYRFDNPKWVAGRLIVQRNGNMAFLWEDVNFVISFRRLHLESLSSELE